VTMQRLTGWLDAYFEAWRSNDATEVAKLFADDATYSYGPFREPARGRDQIVANWVADGPPLTVTYRYEILAADGDTGIVHWNVRQKAYYFHEPTLELDGILVLRFGVDGRCVELLEWFDRRTVEEGRRAAGPPSSLPP
jgi:SnoaL-like domain